MRDYLDHFDVIWSGTEPLLPPRRSKPPRWWTMGGHVTHVEPDQTEITKAREALRPKRAYTRKTNGHLSPVQPESLAPIGEPSLAGAGDRRQLVEPIPDPPNHSQTTTTESS